MIDVILDKDRKQVIVECENLDVRGHDLLLSAQSRLSTGGSIYRRALVHDEGDGLTINFSGDYPGGVTIHGGLAVPGGITYEVPGLNRDGKPVRISVSLTEELGILSQRINELEAKVAALKT